MNNPKDLLELSESILNQLEDRNIKYPDKLFKDVKTLKTSLQGMASLFGRTS